MKRSYFYTSSLIHVKDFILREALFDHLIRQNAYSAAGQVLSGLNLDSNQQIYPESQKVDIYIRCAEAFLEVSFVIFSYLSSHRMEKEMRLKYF